MEKQYIILCLRDFQENSPKDNNFYVQCSRKRYSLEKATKRAEYISKQRNPMVVLVPSVPLDEEGYPR